VKQPRHEIAAAIARRSLAVSGGAADARGTDRASGQSLAVETAAYLIDAHRTSELESLLRDVMQYRADHGIVEVIAVSAFPLNEKVHDDISAEVRKLYPGSKEIIVSHRLDSTVVSGVRLEFANQLLDLSVRNKLNKLKQLTGAGKER
jgi:F0F1-type ATP synthase delta subunit